MTGARDRAPDRLRAARRLRVRTRRQVTDLFAGHYVSAFRGAGIEYAETRAYVPGDDVRSLDWNATARTGVPHVKEHRPERGRTLLLAIDASPSMRFATGAKTKLEAACEAAALLATAALGVGDRCGLVIHDAGRACVLPPERGEAQRRRLLDLLARADDVLDGEAPSTGAPTATRRATAKGRAAYRRPGDVGALLEARRRRGDLVLRFGDARGDGDRGAAAPAVAAASSPGSRSAAGARGEGVYVLCSDPGELAWPDVGAARIAAPQGGPSLVFDGDDALARRRFERAAAERVARVAMRVRARGDDFVHLRSDRDVLRTWLGFFRSRGAFHSRGAAEPGSRRAGVGP